MNINEIIKNQKKLKLIEEYYTFKYSTNISKKERKRQILNNRNIHRISTIVPGEDKYIKTTRTNGINI